MKDDRDGNRVSHGGHSADPHPPTVRKVPADSVPYGESISRNGRTVFVAFNDAGQLVCVGATSSEVRRKYREALRRGDGKC
jgi:hypothetical protein